jgi:hypothetical protein
MIGGNGITDLEAFQETGGAALLTVYSAFDTF